MTIAPRELVNNPTEDCMINSIIIELNIFKLNIQVRCSLMWQEFHETSVGHVLGRQGTCMCVVTTHVWTVQDHNKNLELRNNYIIISWGSNYPPDVSHVPQTDIPTKTIVLSFKWRQ